MVAIDDFDQVEAALVRRNEILKAAIARTVDLALVTDPDQVFRLASADLFVEKAQLVLTQRAQRMWRAGVLATSSAVALLVMLSGFLVWRTETSGSGDITTNRLVLSIVQALSLGAFILVAVKYLVQLSRSFFHENVTLLAKRHALRFGRLYVYANPDATNLKDLQAAFEWNLDTTSSFLDIRAKEIADTIYTRLVEEAGLTAREAIKQQNQKKRRGLSFTS